MWCETIDYILGSKGPVRQTAWSAPSVSVGRPSRAQEPQKIMANSSSNSPYRKPQPQADLGSTLRGPSHFIYEQVILYLTQISHLRSFKHVLVYVRINLIVRF